MLPLMWYIKGETQRESDTIKSIDDEFVNPKNNAVVFVAFTANVQSKAVRAVCIVWDEDGQPKGLQPMIKTMTLFLEALQRSGDHETFEARRVPEILLNWSANAILQGGIFKGKLVN